MKTILVLFLSMGVLGAEQLQFHTWKDASDDWEIVRAAIARDETAISQITFSIRNRSEKALKVGGAKGQANANLSFGPGMLLVAEACHLPHKDMKVEPGSIVYGTVRAVEGFNSGGVSLVIFVDGKRVRVGTLADLKKKGKEGDAGQGANGP